MIIKIDRSSIKLNPNRGNTSFLAAGAVEVSFEVTGKLPDFLKDGENCYITSIDSNKRISGLLNDFSLQADLMKCDGVTVNVKRNTQRIYHAPESTYIYKYENPELKCDYCHKKSTIEEIEIDYDDDGNRCTTCPCCAHINTFPVVEYENITDVENLLDYK